MKIILTADIHFGHGSRLEDCLWATRTIREYAKQNSIDKIIVLGDLFHDRINLNVETNQKVYKFLRDTQSTYGQEWLCFPGNHDMYLKNSWNVTSIHHLTEVMTIIESIKIIKIGDSRFWIVPFIHYESNYMKIIKEIEKKADKDDVLLTHIGVRGAYFNSCFALKNWSIVDFSDTKFSKVYTGHFHCFQELDKVCYPGSPIPFKFDEGMVPHGFLEYNTTSQAHKFIDIKIGEKYFPDEVPPPNFLTIDDNSLDVDVRNSKVRVILSEEKTPNELIDIRNALKSKGAISVKWKPYTEEEIELDETHQQTLDPKNIFKTWIELHKPKSEDIDLLEKLHKEVLEEANEIMIKSDD